MNTSFSVLFYLKSRKTDKGLKVPIYLRFTVNGKRSGLSISRKIDPQKWDARANKARGTSQESKELNIYLDKIRSRVNKIHEKLIEENEPYTAQDLKNLYAGKKEKPKMLVEVFDAHNKQMEKLIDIEFALGTFKRYFTTRNHIYEYVKEAYGREDIPVQDVNLKFIRGFEYFLKEKKGCNHNSSLKYVNNFKKIIRMAVGNEWITKDPFYNYKIKFKTVEREFLSKEELKTLTEREIKWERLAVVRDMFVFCCYTGLAYVDIQKLTPDNIVRDIDGNLFIQAKRTKTKTKLVIPLLSPALSILNKYEDHPKVLNGDCVLPVLSNQKSNAYLKEIALLCGIHKNLTTHLARHTFATTVTLTNGVPLETVGKMLGHKNLRTTQHYAKIIDRKVNEDMKVLSEKLAKEENFSSKMNKQPKSLLNPY
ncbi:site-specific integrase [Aequorivita antarctica]|uniref:Site-specific integrase n=1 Tax=Aequorivita antarctica TaxID=153266 RepID=A0A5C6YZR4_9FLAO|nr:site-specific integrase [Aequorivita antarctica]TXD72705.1 site-specific integrase [Aequorivita antarctica]SRX74772.1 Tyrosine recombinase XerD [Aequorivita antarctica]